MATEDQLDISDRSADKIGKSIAAALKGSNINRDSSTSSFGSSASSISSGISSSATDILGKIKQGGESLYETTGKTLDSWRRASDIGISFNNDALGLRASVGQTRLSVDEWESVIRKGQYGLTALAGGMTESTKVFNKLSRDFSDNTAADQLRMMGWTEKEYNEVLALNMTRRTAFNIKDEQARIAAIESTAELAKEMDAVAKLTGKSRQDMMREQEERNRDVRLQAAIDTEIARGGTKARESFNMMAQEMSATGVEKIGRSLYAGRGLTSQEQYQMAALGNAGTELKSAIEAVKAADKSGIESERVAAQKQFNSAIAAVSERARSEDFRYILQYIDGPLGEAAVGIKEKSTNFDLTMEAIKKEYEAKGKTASPEEIRAEAVRRAQNEMAGKDAENRKISGSNLTEVAVKLGARLKDTEAGLFKIVGAAGEAAGKWEAVGKAASKLVNVAPNAEGKMVSSMERGGLLPEELTKITSSLEKGTLSADLPNIIVTSGKQAVAEGMSLVKDFSVDIAKVMGTSAKDFFEGIFGKPAAPATPSATPASPAIPGRAEGSFGTVGKWIEDWGKETTVKLHGKEGVITEKQFDNLFGAFQQIKSKEGASVEKQLNNLLGNTGYKLDASPIEQQMGGMINNLQSNLSMELEKNRASIPTVRNFEDMFQKLLEPVTNPPSIPSPPASVAPTGSTTTDVKEELVRLNTLMGQLLSQTINVVNNTSLQVRATKQLSGNMLS